VWIHGRNLTKGKPPQIQSSWECPYKVITVQEPKDPEVAGDGSTPESSLTSPGSSSGRAALRREQREQLESTARIRQRINVTSGHVGKERTAIFRLDILEE
jgi:hypothetical protein